MLLIQSQVRWPKYNIGMSMFSVIPSLFPSIAHLGHCEDPMLPPHIQKDKIHDMRLPFFTRSPLDEVLLKGCFATTYNPFGSNGKGTWLPNLCNTLWQKRLFHHLVAQRTQWFFSLNCQVQGGHVFPKLLFIAGMFPKQLHKLLDEHSLFLAGGWWTCY